MLEGGKDKKVLDISGVDPHKCALLVVDELGDVETSPIADVLLAPTLNTARLVKAAHKVGMPVIFANDAHIPELDRELELWGPHGIAGTPDAQTSPQLDAAEGDFVVEKRRYSAFFQTGLRLLLKELGVDTLIICGFDTNICIRHTAADAYFENFNIAVVADATGTFLVGDQQEGLNYMEICYAAAVIDTDEALHLIEHV